MIIAGFGKTVDNFSYVSPDFCPDSGHMTKKCLVEKN